MDTQFQLFRIHCEQCRLNDSEFLHQSFQNEELCLVFSIPCAVCEFQLDCCGASSLLPTLNLIPLLHLPIHFRNHCDPNPEHSLDVVNLCDRRLSQNHHEQRLAPTTNGTTSPNDKAVRSEGGASSAIQFEGHGRV